MLLDLRDKKNCQLELFRMIKNEISFVHASRKLSTLKDIHLFHIFSLEQRQISPKPLNRGYHEKIWHNYSSHSIQLMTKYTKMMPKEVEKGLNFECNKQKNNKESMTYTPKMYCNNFGNIPTNISLCILPFLNRAKYYTNFLLIIIPYFSIVTNPSPSWTSS